MGLVSWFTRRTTAMDDGGTEVSVEDYRNALRHGDGPNSKKPVTSMTALQQVAVYASVRLITGATCNIPLNVHRLDDNGRRTPVMSGDVVNLINWRPNRWQNGRQFRRYMTEAVMLDGNAYALKVRGGNGKVIGLIPMNPARVKVEQNARTLEVEYTYTALNGRQATVAQRDMMHLYLMTLDGVKGISPIGYQREVIAEAMAVQEHGSHTYRNGARVSGLLTTEKELGVKGRQRLKEAMEQYRAGGESEGKTLVLEDGVDFRQVALSHRDAEYIASRKMTRAEIYMIYGVPAHLAADAENQGTGWGTGMEEQRGNFVSFTLEDYLTMWEDAFNRDFALSGSDIRVSHDRKKIVRGDLKSRMDAYSKAIQFGIMNSNEVRGEFELNERTDPDGNRYYPPPNMTDPAGKSDGNGNGEGDGGAPQQESNTGD